MSLLKRAGSTVVEYFEWDLPKVLSQGIAELLKDVDNRSSLQSWMWSSLTVTLIAKGSSRLVFILAGALFYGTVSFGKLTSV